MKTWAASMAEAELQGKQEGPDGRRARVVANESRKRLDRRRKRRRTDEMCKSDLKWRCPADMVDRE